MALVEQIKIVFTVKEIKNHVKADAYLHLNTILNNKIVV